MLVDAYGFDLTFVITGIMQFMGWLVRAEAAGAMAVQAAVGMPAVNTLSKQQVAALIVPADACDPRKQPTTQTRTPCRRRCITSYLDEHACICPRRFADSKAQHIADGCAGAVPAFPFGAQNRGAGSRCQGDAEGCARAGALAGRARASAQHCICHLPPHFDIWHAQQGTLPGCQDVGWVAKHFDLTYNTRLHKCSSTMSRERRAAAGAWCEE